MLDPPDRESTESCIELSLSRSQVIIPQFNPSLLLTFRTNSTKLKRSLIDTRVTREAFVKLQTSNVCYNTLGSPKSIACAVPRRRRTPSSSSSKLTCPHSAVSRSRNKPDNKQEHSDTFPSLILGESFNLIACNNYSYNQAN